MGINRRSFLGSILAAAAAPAFVRAESGVLMPVSSRGLVVPDKSLLFDCGEQVLFPGDTLELETMLASGVIVLSEYEVVGFGTCYGVDIYGELFPKQVPRGSARLVGRAEHVRWNRAD